MSDESKICAESPPNSSTSNFPYDVLHVDVIPSRFIITPEAENCVRKIATHFVSFIKTKYPHVRVAVTYLQHIEKSDDRSSFVQDFRNPQIWKCYPKLIVHGNSNYEGGQMSAYAQSWKSIHTIFSQFHLYRSCIASISSLSVGFCPAKDQTFMKNLSSSKISTYLFDLRLAVPTLHPDVNYLLATPPSLPWSLSVALSFFRLQAVDGEARENSSSNLTIDTVGVLQNWIDFMLYGTLLDSEDEKVNHLSEDWIRSTSKSFAESTSIFPAVITIVFDCSSIVSTETFSTDILDEQLVDLDKAWRDAVQTNVQQSRNIVLISLKQLENATDLDKVFDEIDIVCQKRFVRSS